MATISLSPLNGMEGAELLSFQWGQLSNCSNQGHTWLGKKGHLFYFLVYILGPHLAVLRGSPWLLTQESLLADSWDPMGCRELNLSWVYVCQAHTLLATLLMQPQEEGF